jgi:hypothetical protein
MKDAVLMIQLRHHQEETCSFSSLYSPSLSVTTKVPRTPKTQYNSQKTFSECVFACPKKKNLCPSFICHINPVGGLQMFLG